MVEPTFTGTFGSAYKVTLPAPAERERPAMQASLVSWFLHMPGSHPFWSCYLLSLVHLREIEGAPPAFKRYPDATHEIHVIALNPEKSPKPDDMTTWQCLTPINVVEQFEAKSDDDAVLMLEQLARACVDGLLYVEPQGVRGARERWTTTVTRTAEHLRLGGHPMPVMGEGEGTVH